MAETCLLVQDWVAKLGEPATLQMLFRTYSLSGRVPRAGSRRCKPLGQTRHDGPLLEPRPLDHTAAASSCAVKEGWRMQRYGGCEDLQIAGTHTLTLTRLTHHHHTPPWFTDLVSRPSASGPARGILDVVPGATPHWRRPAHVRSERKGGDRKRFDIAFSLSPVLEELSVFSSVPKRRIIVLRQVQEPHLSLPAFTQLNMSISTHLNLPVCVSSSGSLENCRSR